MKIRFFNAKIARFGGAAPTLDAGELHVGDDGRIAHAGPAPAQPAGPFDREIDCRGGLLLPGFKNAHTHSAMTFLRSHADDLPLARWLEEQVFPYEDQLTGRDVKALVRLAILEYVSGGQTAAFDMYFNQDEAAEAAIEAGFRFVMVSAVNDYGGTAREAEAEYRRFNELHPLIGYRIGVHAEYTTSEPLLKDMAALARALHEPFYTHLAETRAEVEGCYARYGMSPLEKLDALGAFAYGGGGFHMVHLSPADLDIAAARGLCAVTCPASNLKLASGVAPVCAMLRRGIPVAIGTDGPASNNCLDFFREMFLVSGLQKAAEGDAAACGALDVLQMACANGARAMGLSACDDLAPGKQADLVLLELRAPNMQPENDVLKNVVYSGGKQNVRLTMVAGRILYEDGAFYTGCDPERVYAEANAIIRRMDGRA